jgi:hypothetical protein
MDSLFKSAGLLHENYKVILMIRSGLIGLGASMALTALMTLLLLAFISSGVVAQDALNANGTANVSSLTESISTPAGPADIHGIWKVSLAGTDIVMAVNQSGDSLFGQCKFEGDSPWNGVISGEVSGRIVHIATAALQGKMLTCMSLRGDEDGDQITGSYVRYDSSGTAAKGEMTAIRISADTSEYTPAKIESNETQNEEQTAEQPTAEHAQQLGALSQTTQPSVTSRGTFTDVTQLAKSIDPNIMPNHAPL